VYLIKPATKEELADNFSVDPKTLSANQPERSVFSPAEPDKLLLPTINQNPYMVRSEEIQQNIRDFSKT
jgi:hypothetical protein